MPLRHADGASPASLSHALCCQSHRHFWPSRRPHPNQRVSGEGTLKAVTIDTAYSLQMEREVGSIVPGKLELSETAKIDDIVISRFQGFGVAMYPLPRSPRNN